ncbi:hypothetical protein IW261DRAFT_820683 [Armillaria novae-zelandiae]|uniref:Uncharacterized protein n=1 Tax=Armillaria novae-zelandiae TaxID=153914 RepID=A0AA39NU93_9AGAR|nr:hypothetical protein IW261DRAFT_820683 [Armillaria novae-zelandiae]
MAEDRRHALSLSTSTPSVHHQTNKVLWPVFTWYNADVEISSVEVEEIFGVKLFIDGYSREPFMSKTLLTTVHELNADYTFDTARGGADVCEYFGRPLMEILDVSTGDWMPLHGTVPESASVTSNNRYRTSSIKIVSPLDNASEVEHAGEASTKAKFTSAAQMRNLELSHGPWMFIVMFIVISVTLLHFSTEVKERGRYYAMP